VSESAFQRKCGLCLRPTTRNMRARLTLDDRAVFSERICDACFDAIDAVRQEGLERARV
jgi:hypothetical protein